MPLAYPRQPTCRRRFADRGGFLRCVRVKALTSVEMTSSTIDRFKAFPLGGRCRVATDEGKRPYTVGVHSLPVGEPPMASRPRPCLQNNRPLMCHPKGKALISRTQPTQNTRRRRLAAKCKIYVIRVKNSLTFGLVYGIINLLFHERECDDVRSVYSIQSRFSTTGNINQPISHAATA